LGGFFWCLGWVLWFSGRVAVELLGVFRVRSWIFGYIFVIERGGDLVPDVP